MRRGQGRNRMAVLHERVWFLRSQLAELRDVRSRVEQAEERKVDRRSKVTGAWAMPRRSRDYGVFDSRKPWRPTWWTLAAT